MYLKKKEKTGVFSHLGKKIKQSHKKSYKFKHVLLGKIVVYVSSGDYDLYLKLYVI